MSKQNLREEKIQTAVLTRLNALAQRTGKTINELLEEILDERECVTRQREEVTENASVPADEWSRMLRSWAVAHPVSSVVADDSRESIYAGRGE